MPVYSARWRNSRSLVSPKGARESLHSVSSTSYRLSLSLTPRRRSSASRHDARARCRRRATHARPCCDFCRESSGRRRTSVDRCARSWSVPAPLSVPGSTPRGAAALRRAPPPRLGLISASLAASPAWLPPLPASSLGAWPPWDGALSSRPPSSSAAPPLPLPPQAYAAPAPAAAGGSGPCTDAIVPATHQGPRRLARRAAPPASAAVSLGGGGGGGAAQRARSAAVSPFFAPFSKRVFKQPAGQNECCST